MDELTILAAVETLKPDELRELADCLSDIADMPPEQRGKAYRAALALQRAVQPVSAKD